MNTVFVINFRDIVGAIAVTAVLAIAFTAVILDAKGKKKK